MTQSGMNERPSIPDPIKREMRKRCGFGCVVCGLPLYEYHHIIGFSAVQDHAAENITLLCNRHHAEFTKNLLTVEKVREKNEAPFNIINEQSSPYLLHYRENSCDFVVGTNIMKSIECLDAIRIDDDTILGFRRENGTILTTFACYDETDQKILQISDNELRYSTGLWDVEFIGKRLTIRRGSRDIIASILF